MKLKYINKGLELSYGPVMWHCTNGRENHRNNWSISWFTMPESGSKEYGPWRTPCLSFMPWKKGVLSTIDPLGITSHHASLHFEFLWWDFGFRLHRSVHSKTDAEVYAPQKSST